MSEWVAISGYDLDKSYFRFIGGKRLFFCKARITFLSSSIDMGYGGASKAFVMVVEHKRWGIPKCSEVPFFLPEGLSQDEKRLCRSGM